MNEITKTAKQELAQEAKRSKIERAKIVLTDRRIETQNRNKRKSKRMKSIFIRSNQNPDIYVRIADASGLFKKQRVDILKKALQIYFKDFFRETFTEGGSFKTTPTLHSVSIDDMLDFSITIEETKPSTTTE